MLAVVFGGCVIYVLMGQVRYSQTKQIHRFTESHRGKVCVDYFVLAAGWAAGCELGDRREKRKEGRKQSGGIFEKEKAARQSQ